MLLFETSLIRSGRFDPSDLAHHWDRSVLVMEDPGGIPLEQLVGDQSPRREPRPTDVGGEPLDQLSGTAQRFA